MARIDYSDPAKLDERTNGIVAKNRSANIFRMMAHSPDYLRQYCRLGAAIRFRGELDPVLREREKSVRTRLPLGDIAFSGAWKKAF